MNSFVRSRTWAYFSHGDRDFLGLPGGPLKPAAALHSLVTSPPTAAAGDSTIRMTGAQPTPSKLSSARHSTTKSIVSPFLTSTRVIFVEASVWCAVQEIGRAHV